MVNNSYKETYVIFLMYEHVFSMLYEDGSSIDTRHRLLRKLGTPLLCRAPFTADRESAHRSSHNQAEGICRKPAVSRLQSELLLS